MAAPLFFSHRRNANKGRVKFQSQHLQLIVRFANLKSLKLGSFLVDEGKFVEQVTHLESFRDKIFSCTVTISLKFFN